MIEKMEQSSWNLLEKSRSNMRMTFTGLTLDFRGKTRDITPSEKKKRDPILSFFTFNQNIFSQLLRYGILEIINKSQVFRVKTDSLDTQVFLFLFFCSGFLIFLSNFLWNFFTVTLTTTSLTWTSMFTLYYFKFQNTEWPNSPSDPYYPALPYFKQSHGNAVTGK